MNQNRKPYRFYWIGAILLLSLSGFAFFAFDEFEKSLTPYVSYQEAMSSARNVQVAGGLEKGSSSYEDATQSLHFTLVDPAGKGTLRVRYPGLKPANFEDAISVVAIGRFDRTTQEFAADKLLVKCPSKYQGLEAQTKTYD